jgi:hypothetical protein
VKRCALFFGLIAVAACGGGSTGPNNNNGNPSGSVKVLTATINGAAFTGNEIVGAFLQGSGITINASSTTRTITISGNIPGPGTYQLGQGNQWSLLAQVHGDATAGTFSTGFGGAGTFTVEIATLFRIKGTFSFTAYTVAGGGVGKPVVTVQNGTFDISNP